MIRRALILATATATATALAVAGCSSPPKPRADTAGATSVAPSPTASPSPIASPSPTGQPKTYEAAKAAVDRIDAAARARDGGALWDSLTTSGQALISRDDFARLVKDCPKMYTDTTTVSVGLDAGGGSATVTTTQPGGQYTWQMVYENGQWKRQPSSGAADWMKLGGDKALAVLRNEGAC